MSTWPRALTLTERRAPLQRYLRERPASATPMMDKGRATVDMWRELPSMSNEARFSSLLAAYGLTREELTAMASVPAEELANHLDARPGWLEFALCCFRDMGEDAYHDDGNAQQACDLGLLGPMMPFVLGGARRLDAELRLAEQQSKDPAFAEYYRVVPAHLVGMIIKPFVVEMHIASRSGLLQASDPESRYREFVSQLSSRAGAAAFFKRYPVLLRLCAERVQVVASAISEVLTSLEADRALLLETFGDLGELTSLELGLGDAHCGGRTVTKLVFAEGRTILRKPRSLAIDQAYHWLLDWLSPRLQGTTFALPTMLDRTSHGYMEFMRHQPCDSLEQVQRFYYRQGVHLALAYLLGGSDLHQENVIACGEQPVLVDIETLFAARSAEPPERSANALAARILRESVLNSGLLPTRFRFDRRHNPIDVSGLGGEGGQPTPTALPIWHDVGSDRMHLRRESGRVSASENLPVLDGKRMAAWQFERELLAGLAHALDAVKAEPTPIAQFLERCSELPVRVVLRPTSEYEFVLGESYHPYHLGDALDRDRYLDQLGGRVTLESCSAAIFAAEKHDLWAGDIPLFRALPGSTSLWTSSGTEFPSAFELDGIHCAKERIAELSDDEVARQTWLVRVSFARPSHRHVSPSGDQLLRPEEFSSPLEAALTIGRYVRRRAITSRGEAAWLTVAEIEGGVLEPTVSGADLYSGLPGIILFLAYLGRLSGEREYRDLARTGLAGLLGLVERGDRALSSCGAFDGLGGIFYVLAHMGTLLEDESLFTLAESYIGKATALLSSSSPVDVVGGAAGCSLGLLSLHAVHRSEAALNAAMLCGDLLLSRRHPKDGPGWGPGLEPDSLRTVLCGGFGHGVAGILYALSNLHEATNEPRYRRAVELALSPPIKGYDSEIRSDGPTSWCRGWSGGIGAVAAILASHSYSEEAGDAVHSFVRQVLEGELMESDCLCHGEMGNLDMLGQAGTAAVHGPALLRRTRAVLARAASRGWTYGLPVDSVGLMDGVAGIGYQLLRSTAPEQVPSVLRLRPPTV